MLLVAAVIGGCNQIYGISSTELVDAAPDADTRPDRDVDGIADIEDSCIAPAADLAEDSDGDGIPNASDSCPFALPSTNGDGDGVDDACDAFVDMAGDRHLCTMRFLRLETTAALWKARPGESDFAIGNGYLIGFGQKSALMSFVAQERIVPPTGTSQVQVAFAATRPFTFRLWVSAQPTPSAEDVACDVTGDDQGVTVSLVGVTGEVKTPGTIPALPDSGISFAVQFQPNKTGPNVVCAAFYDNGIGGGSAFAGGHFDGPLGQQGMAVIGDTSASVSTLVTHHREDQPQLF